MIAYLEGRILAQVGDGNACVLLTSNGVGYLVHLTVSVAQSLSLAKDEAVAFYIATIVHSDSIKLYGFITSDERETFLICLDIANLGPKLAMSLLSTYNPDDLRRIVTNNDSSLLTRVPGIGKKRAQQIFLELKYKLKIVENGLSPTCSNMTKISGSFHDALAGLINLGYLEGEVWSILEQVFAADSDIDTTTALHKALKIIAKNK